MTELRTLEPHDLARATGGTLPKVGRGPIPVWRGVASLLWGAGKAAIFGTGITTIGLEGIDLLKTKVENQP